MAAARLTMIYITISYIFICINVMMMKRLSSHLEARHGNNVGSQHILFSGATPREMIAVMSFRAHILSPKCAIRPHS